MFPGGVNPKQMKRMMKQMGVKMTEIDALEVIIKTAEKEIVISNPQVVRTNVQGQDMWQISGEVKESEIEVKIEISEDDVEMVSTQAGVSKDQARSALEKADGDLAEAIIDLKG
ncbi:MAG: nascent polypeptide-associated complex protein [Candidatus Altiarchaeota archaeon]